MHGCFRTKNFLLEYTESMVDSPVLWESHCHPRYEMIAVLEGDITIMLEGVSYRLTEQQAAMIPPLHYHTVTANKRGAYRRITALLDTAAIPTVLQELFLKREASPTIFYLPQIENLKRICQQKDTAFYEPLAESMMTQLCYSALESKQTETKRETDEFLQRMILYIDRHLGEKILLADLAKHAALSQSSVCHLFQKKMKISPKQYILQKKLALAAKLIRDGTPPTLAAMQVGYDNYSNFYRMYRKYLQATPMEDKERGGGEAK